MRSRHSVDRALFFAVLVLSGCEKPVPETPRFETDIKPIFDAHCVRCHGAGGTLNADPRAREVAGPGSYLDQYEDKVDCTPDAMGNIPQTCVPGARFEAVVGNIHLFLNGGPLQMPLPPAAPLSPWELDVVNHWLAETPPMP
jgi:hypothetical protein